MLAQVKTDTVTFHTKYKLLHFLRRWTKHTYQCENINIKKTYQNMEPKTICDMWKQWFFKETDRINRRKVMQTAFMLQGFFIVMAQLLSLSAFNGVCG